MHSQRDVVNQIIAADDLYWDDMEQKYVALSPDEIDNIIKMCIENDLVEQSQIMSVMHWCTNARVGEILMKNFLNGSIGIRSIDNTGEPEFVKK